MRFADGLNVHRDGNRQIESRIPRIAHPAPSPRRQWARGSRTGQAATLSQAAWLTSVATLRSTRVARAGIVNLTTTARLSPVEPILPSYALRSSS